MHEQYLIAALKQARLGQGQCAPNPSVGAVAVQNGMIIAQDWHRGAGTLHAEQLVLAKIPPHTSGITLYITLEPCNHWGQTPPCVNAIIDAGIEKVVFAYLDPNPLVAQNNSSALLSAKGIEVVHAPLPEIDEFYESYAYWTRVRSPKLTIKLAQSLDGKIAGGQGQPYPLSNDLCAVFTHQQRKNSDIILTSATTVNNDNPSMNARIDGQKIAKPVAIIDTHLSIKPDSQIFSTAECCHIYHSDKIKPERKYPNSQLHPISEIQGRLDLSQLIKHLGELGYHDVWIEVGGTLFSAFHEQNLVHKTYLYITPKVLGSDSLSGFHKPHLLDKPHQIEWIPKGDNVIACFEWETN